jgi:dimethylargininase
LENLVKPVEVTGCLHLKSAISFIGQRTVLANRQYIDWKQLDGFDVIDVPTEEPNAANALLLRDAVIVPESFPRTCELLERQGFSARTIDVSELQKAESGVTCMSLIFNHDQPA